MTLEIMGWEHSKLKSYVIHCLRNWPCSLFLSVCLPLPLPQFLCTVIAILLHYVYMSTFSWTFVESLHVYRMLTEVRNIDAGPMRFYYVVGWGIPAIVTGEHAQSGHSRPGTRGTSQEPTSVPPVAGRGALWPRPGHPAPTSAHRSVITQCPCQV